nr:acetoacetyl-CoA synthetase [Parasteatoda tepidariorum]
MITVVKMPGSTLSENIYENGENNNSLKVSSGKNGLIETLVSKPIVIWNKKVPDTEMDKFKRVIEEKYNQHFGSYWEFHKWSVDNYIDCWEEIWHYFGVIGSKSYDQVLVKTGKGFLDNDWFSGARFNYAENILRIRDSRVALVCADEDGNEEAVTFAEMFEEVKLYASALRSLGVKMNDRELFRLQIFTCFCSLSVNLFSFQAASNVLSTMEPKVLFTVDEHSDNGVKFHPIDNLEDIVNNTPSLEKVVIVHTNDKTLSRDISNIRNSCFLEEFLECGKTPDGTTPDIVFEQLPFNHPIVINFTSGTTGLPKAPLHSAGTFLAELRDFAFHLNLKSGDTIYTCYPVGWTLWDTMIPPLALGVKLYLHAGCPHYTEKGANVWDIFSRHKVTFAFIVTCIVDRLEKENIMPKPGTNLDCLKVIGIGGSPVKRQNFEYLRKVKSDVFVGSMYGATEVFGAFSGFEFNTPSYGGEIQAPALGVDIKCYDENGQSVVGERGELVVATPTPSFPVFLWKDIDNRRMNDTYFSKYEGVWSQNDECWINPKTHGIVVIGRSDDTLKQHGERFGSGDIYFAIHQMEELQDYICVGQDGTDGDTRAVLFVKLKKGHTFTPQLKKKIADTIDRELWVDYVPEVILETPDIPYNLNNKRMESVVRRIISTNQIPDTMNIKNPGCLQYFCNIPDLLNYKGNY